MIEVKQVISGDFHPKNLFEVLQASVLLEDMQADVNKGKGNCFGWVLEFARNIYGQFKEQAKGWNDPKVEWWQAAAAQFQSESQAALTAGELQYSKQQLNTFKNAVASIKQAMLNGFDLLERDPATGSFKLASKGALEQRNKKFKQEQEAREQAERMEAVRAAQAAGGLAGVQTTANEKAEISTESDGLLEGLPHDVAELVRQYVAGVKEACEKGGKSGAVASLNKGIRSMQNHIRNSLNELKRAANA